MTDISKYKEIAHSISFIAAGMAFCWMIWEIILGSSHSQQTQRALTWDEFSMKCTERSGKPFQDVNLRQPKCFEAQSLKEIEVENKKH